MHERRLHVYAQHDAEPDEIDAKTIGGRPKQRNDDERDFEEIEKKRQQENEHIDKHEKADNPAGEGDQ